MKTDVKFSMQPRPHYVFKFKKICDKIVESQKYLSYNIYISIFPIFLPFLYFVSNNPALYFSVNFHFCSEFIHNNIKYSSVFFEIHSKVRVNRNQ